VSANLDYSEADFSVRVQPHSREAVSVIYKGHGIELTLDGERIGSKREGLNVRKSAEFPMM
jgi:hypothetical protein